MAKVIECCVNCKHFQRDPKKQPCVDCDKVLKRYHGPKGKISKRPVPGLRKNFEFCGTVRL